MNLSNGDGIEKNESYTSHSLRFKVVTCIVSIVYLIPSYLRKVLVETNLQEGNVKEKVK